MLKITGLRSSNPQDYYLEVIARGAEEYYLRRPDHAGVWIGAGSSRLGLDGTVAPDDLRAILDQRHPVTREKLPARQIRRVGFDLTLSAPKSVSLLWALGDPDQSAAALDAHLAAVRRRWSTSRPTPAKSAEVAGTATACERRTRMG